MLPPAGCNTVCFWIYFHIFSPSHSLTFLTVTTVCLFVFQPSDFSVSLKAVGKNKHFKVQLSDGVYCIGQRRFNSMDELVEHYKKAPIFTSEHGEKLYLVKALLWFTHPHTYTGCSYTHTCTLIHQTLMPLPDCLNSSLSSGPSCCGVCTTSRSSLAPPRLICPSSEQAKLSLALQPSR